MDRRAEQTRLARTYVWWQEPRRTLASPAKLLRQILSLGRPEDFVAARALWGDHALRRALREAARGEVDTKSASFWRLWFGLRP